MARYPTSTYRTRQTKRTLLGGDENQTCFALRRMFGTFTPTHRTPPPAESVVELREDVPPLDSPAFDDWLKEFHATRNG